MMMAAVLVIAIFYRQPLASVLFVFLIILPFISLYAGKYGSNKISITASAPAGHVEEGDEFRIRLHLKNSSPVPLLRCTLKYTYFNSYRPDDEDFSITLAGESFASETFNLSFRTSMPGVFTFSADTLLISDPLHFHTFRKKADIHVMIPVMPKTVEIPDIALSRFEGEPFDDIVSESGELTRDIRQLREYRAGDRLKDIHWKASAVTGELVVKEYERSVDLMYLLLPEIRKGAEAGALRRYYSLGKKMTGAGMGFRTAVYNPQDRTFSYFNVSDETGLGESLYEIMRMEAAEADVYEMYRAQNPGSYGVIRICEESIIST
ncbi:MAG: DUF58 domain-containing protein [Lachnospiraceae bacterium]|nr:DUF58 domain-containing protein [Lachnospiraceae bacterium]